MIALHKRLAELRWATLDDLRRPAHRQIFASMEHLHDRFAYAHEMTGVDDYPWPVAPLYEWSRRLEYPFVAECLSDMSRGSAVLDVASGVTFLPVFLREVMKLQPECLDRDPDVARRLHACCDRMTMPRLLMHTLDLAGSLPIEDECYDAAVAVGLLDHLPPIIWRHALREMWRLIRPGGRLVMTASVAFDEESPGLPAWQIEDFVGRMSDVFGRLPDPGAPPADALTTDQPGVGLMPLRVGNRVVKGGIEGWRLRWNADPAAPPARQGLLLMCLHRDMVAPRRPLPSFAASRN